jgi:hypothetical protein
LGSLVITSLTNHLTPWTLQLSIHNFLLFIVSERSSEFCFFDLNAQIDGLVVDIPVDSMVVPYVVLLSQFLVLSHLLLVAVVDKGHDVSVSFTNHVKLNPLGEVARTQFNSPLQIVTIVFGSANNSQHEVSLAQVAALEAAGRLVDYRY